MKRENLYEPFEIVCKISHECTKLEHQHSFFELVYILSGTGKQHINEYTLDYKSGQMFLITPQDYHSFDVDTATEFFLLRFNDIYIKSKALQSENIQRLEFILQNANHKPGCILKNQSDKNLVRPLIEALVREVANRDLYDKEITQQLVNTLIVVVARNIAKYLPQQISENTDEKIVAILNYIQANIYEPELVRTENICRHFGISENYLGRYFKKHSGETLQSYITNYKLSLVEYRLKHSDKRINEIVAELGFTDQSHFNKFFRQQKGMSPKAFREHFMNARVA
ncbi:AraC family transcriptional regulator [Chitinophaga sp. Cy-1792]|uniref:AraC family transcriptional regulator n=1 Tax=Chitinophaga sp. Cy-1792 TaxID=2608339 RepID=UPI001423DE78|nr:AraC family transcriptional regulator [Chitinophaga sp. Cy-1792]NIG55103.1 AraC family transcriptional regulator [Chitinophaga sp. Cy-1792]